MILKEDFGRDNLKQVFNKIRSNFESGKETFDETVATINFWCDGDEDKTIFMQSGEAYAPAITYLDILDSDEEELIQYIKQQLTVTEDE